MYDTLKTTKEILNKYGFYAKKSFGQNFLVNDTVLFQIANIPDVNFDDLIIEIGPGLGNLTHYLKEKSNLLLFEVDPRMINVLNDRFKEEKNIEIVLGDVLKVDIDSEISILEEKLKKKFNKVKVVANLPYYITSPILFKLLEDSKRVEEIIVMIQNEVAERISAKVGTKDYGILSVMVDFYANSTKEIIVKPSSFIPAPKVTSAVIKIVKQEKYKDVNAELFKKLVHAAFANRRKKMINSLVMNNFLNLDKEEIKNIFRNLNLTDNTRAEELSTSKYIEIVNYLKDIKGV